MENIAEISHLVLFFGATLPLILLPSTLLNVFDAMGWRAMLANGNRILSFISLFKTHLSSEAIARSIPAGIPLADSVRSLILKKENSVPVSESVIGILTRRWSLGVTQCVFLAIGVMIGFPAITRVSNNFFGNRSLGPILLLSSLLISFLFFGALVALQTGGLAKRICFLLGLIPSKQFVLWLQKHGERFSKVDAHFAALRTVGSRGLFISSCWYFATWWMELLETYFLLRLIGIDVTLQEAFAIETLVSAMRFAAFFLPAGIGVQEAGYIGISSALGISATQADIAMFLICKRSRDFFWIVLGYSLLLLKGIVPSRKGVNIRLTEA